MELLLLVVFSVLSSLMLILCCLSRRMRIFSRRNQRGDTTDRRETGVEFINSSFHDDNTDFGSTSSPFHDIGACIAGPTSSSSSSSSSSASPEPPPPPPLSEKLPRKGLANLHHNAAVRQLEREKEASSSRIKDEKTTASFVAGKLQHLFAGNKERTEVKIAGAGVVVESAGMGVAS